MNTLLDQELRNYHRQFSDRHAELRGDLETRLAPLAPQADRARVARGWRWQGLSLLTTAAAVLVVVAVWLLGPRDLCAKVLDALKTASTIHCEGARYDADGKKIARAEVWYDRQRGVREEVEENGRKQFRVDNGTYEWQFVAGTRFATRSESRDPLGMVREALDPVRVIRLAVRQPEQDAKVDGVPCQCYQSEGPEHSFRSRIWIDSQFHIRRFLRETRRGDAWIRGDVIEVHYDVPIDAKRFVPDFIEGVRLLTSDESYDKRFGLDGALAKKEVMGNVLAVHELQRISDRMFFLVYSIRPSEETEKRFGSRKEYGDFGPVYWRRLDDKREIAMQPWSLGSFASENGYLKIEWSVVILQGAWDLPLKEFDVAGYVHTRNDLARALEQAGKPWWHLYIYSEPLMRLPLRDRKSSLDEVTAKTYEDILQLMPLAAKKASIWLSFGLRPMSEEEIQHEISSGVPERQARRMSRQLSSTPKRMSLEEYQAAVRAWIEKKLSP
jgi:hypothetical protein